MPDRPPKDRPSLNPTPSTPITVQSAAQFASDEIRDILNGIKEVQPMQIAHCTITLTTNLMIVDKQRFGDSETHESTLSINLELEAKSG